MAVAEEHKEAQRRRILDRITGFTGLKRLLQCGDNGSDALLNIAIGGLNP
jgi:hypothetical protein